MSDKEKYEKFRDFVNTKAAEYVKTHHSASSVSDFQAAMNIAVIKAYIHAAGEVYKYLKDNKL